MNAPAHVDIRFSLPRGPAYEGEWVPLRLNVTRPSDADRSVKLREITCDDEDIQLDLDLLDRETPIRPGESYQLTMPLRARRPKVVGLGHITVHVLPEDAAREEPYRLAATALEIRPAIARHIAVTVEPLCVYADGTKVLLTLKHVGSTVFQDLTVNFHPQEAIRGGKPTIQRQTFKSADEEQLEFVVAGNDIEVVMAATVDGQRTDWRGGFAIGPPPTLGQKRFHFLEPRQLSTDVTAMFEMSGEASSAVDSTQGIYSISGGNQYHLVIRPQHAGVTSIKVREIAGVVHVRDSQQARDGGWRFLIDVNFADLLRKPEVIFYDVESRGEHLTGEVPICLKPPRLRHWQVAAALGLALTVQGVAAIAQFLRRTDFDLTELFSDFRWQTDYNLLFLLSIPTSLLLIKTVDWLQFRWQQ